MQRERCSSSSCQPPPHPSPQDKCFALAAYTMIVSDSVAADPRASEPEAERAPPGPSVARSPVVRLDDVFNFQVVVFQVFTLSKAFTCGCKCIVGRWRT